MPAALKRIFAVFAIVAMLPLAYVTYELMSLNKNEAIIREIYQNQLDAILYSVNQFSNDLITSWANQLSTTVSSQPAHTPDSLAQAVRQMLNQSPAIRYVYFADSTKSMLIASSDSVMKTTIQPILDDLVTRNQPLLNRLSEYKSAGYQRMEVLDSFEVDGLLPILFALDAKRQEFSHGLMLLDQNAMISQNLSPKMQSIAGDDFIISARRLADDSLIYATESINSRMEGGIDPRENWQQREFWLLPKYYIGISLKGTTMNEALSDRRNTTLIILAILMVILISGISFLFLNIKREMYLSKAKSEFVSNVSHEIRTPLSLISMFAETLEMGRVKTEEKKLEYYSIIRKETVRLSTIVNGILSFSQMDANKRVYHFESIDLNEVCKEIISKYAFQLNENEFSYIEQYDGEIPSIQGDLASINEVIINLLDNAIKYSLTTKEIRIATGTKGKWVYVEICDKGIGIAKEYHVDIFEQFFRTPSHDIHNTKGSGLGLAIVKRIMDAHNGQIDLQSLPNEGSTFRLNFPLETNHKA